MDPHLVGATPELAALDQRHSESKQAASDRSGGPAATVEPARSGAFPRRRPLRRSRAGAFCALAALFFVALTLTPAQASAQGVSTSAVRGQVTTPDGLPLSDVTVVVVHEPSRTCSTDVTDSEGRYYVPNLRPGGPYTLEASRLGFASSHREGLTLPLSQAVDVDVVLSEEAVEVPEIAVEVEQDPVFNPARMGSMTLVDATTVESVPNIRRDLLRYADLSPLASVTDDGVSVAGQNPRFNALQIDGALSQDVFGASSSGVVGGRAGARSLPLEAVEQFQVLTAPYDVRHAGFTGGVLNAVTKSGTNEWTGTLFGNWRDEALVGDLVVDEVARAPDQLDKLHLGIAGGGPLVEDRLHLYAAGEFERRRQPPTGLEVGVDGPLRTGVPVDSAAEMVSLLEGRGFDPGTLGATTLENWIGNAFLRLDADLGGGHRGVVRYHYAGASDQPPPNRLPGEPYDFSSHGSTVETNSHSAVVQLLSDLGDGISNDLLVNVQFIREEVRPTTEDPRVEVELAGIREDFAVSRRVRAGAPLDAHLDEVDQDVLQIEDNLTVSAGDHRLLVGAGLQRFGISRRFVPQSRGSYHFRPFSLGDQHVGGLDALRRNQPVRYEIGLLRDGVADAEVGFPVWQFAGWLQDTWRPAERLNLRAGLRVDVPTLPETPPPNDALEEELGVRTDRVPSGNLLVSPRLGLNWKPFESGATQLRAGAGLFTGRPPLVWLAHAYEDTGLRTFVLACEGVGVAPELDPGAPTPEACADGSTSEAGGRSGGGLLRSGLPLSAGAEGVGGDRSAAAGRDRRLRGVPDHPLGPPGGAAERQPARARGIGTPGLGLLDRLRLRGAVDLRDPDGGGLRPRAGLRGARARHPRDERRPKLRLGRQPGAEEALRRPLRPHGRLRPQPDRRHPEPAHFRRGRQPRAEPRGGGSQPTAGTPGPVRPTPQGGAVGLGPVLRGVERHPCGPVLRGPVGPSLLLRLRR